MATSDRPGRRGTAILLRASAATGNNSTDAMPAPIKVAAVPYFSRPDQTPMSAMATTNGSSVAENNQRAIRDRRSSSRRTSNAGRPRTTRNSPRNIGNCSNANREEINACKYPFRYAHAG